MVVGEECAHPGVWFLYELLVERDSWNISIPKSSFGGTTVHIIHMLEQVISGSRTKLILWQLRAPIF